MTDSGYHSSRLAPDPRRDVLWRTLCDHFFAELVERDDCVLDLGCGYGHFINNIRAARRIALDSWTEFPSYIEEGIRTIVGPVTDLSGIPDHSVDFAFASNLFEHISQAEFRSVLASLRCKLTSKGELTILQPNFRYCASEYFDDYTHVAIYSHVSIADFLAANGYEVIEVKPRFMPLSVKSKLPVSSALIRLYLLSPIKPLGKQMLIRARPVPTATPPGS